MDKKAVLRALQARLQEDVEQITQSQRNSQEGAFHEENVAEDDKDTRAIEASYLARGLADRVVAAREALGVASMLQLRAYDDRTPIGLTALVTVEDDESGAVTHCFLCTVGGGLRLSVDSATVRVITPSSPLGQALVGRSCEDEVSYDSPQGPRTLIITAVT